LHYRHHGDEVSTPLGMRQQLRRATRRERLMPSLIWIIIVVLVVLFLLGFFGRGRLRG
jgi:flagellar basal body-associated protein FliL